MDNIFGNAVLFFVLSIGSMAGLEYAIFLWSGSKKNVKNS